MLPALAPLPGSGRSHWAGRRPSWIARHSGRPSHPAWVRWAPAAAAARKHRAKEVDPASSSAKQRAAASGRRSRRTGKASAHAAQYAAGATRSAHWSPSPPRRAGKSTRRRAAATSGSRSSGSPRRSRRHCQTASSWPRAYDAERSGGRVRSK